MFTEFTSCDLNRPACTESSSRSGVHPLLLLLDSIACQQPRLWLQATSLHGRGGRASSQLARLGHSTSTFPIGMERSSTLDRLRSSVRSPLFLLPSIQLASSPVVKQVGPIRLTSSLPDHNGSWIEDSVATGQRIRIISTACRCRT